MSWARLARDVGKRANGVWTPGTLKISVKTG